MSAPGTWEKELTQHIEWMAQTVHQGYHSGMPGTWRECPRDICLSTVRLFANTPVIQELRNRLYTQVTALRQINAEKDAQIAALKNGGHS